MTKPPFTFDEFFASGKEETISPFLTKDSRGWGKNLSLKASILSAAFLTLSFITSFYLPPLSHLLLIIVYFLSGTPALIDAIEDIKNLQINIDVLMTLAALLSVLIGSGLEGALLLVLFELSGSLEEMVTGKTKGALQTLHNLSPKIGCIVNEDGTLYEKSTREISVGTTLLVKAGEVVPLDGLVIKGSSEVNLVHLTGESQPISKKEGDEVPAGGQNLNGTLTIKVTRTSSDSTLSRIIVLITQAQAAKPRVQKLLDRFGKVYASSIIALSVFFALMLPVFFSFPFLGYEGSIYRALTFLIAASPCALIIATPTAYLSGISSAARRGILLKGGVIFDALTHCQTIAFDKTGTLTTGALDCIAVESLQKSSINEETALAIASTLERHAVHPIATAICNLANDKKISHYDLETFQSVPGYGLEGTIKRDSKIETVAIGNREFIEQKITTSKLPSSISGIHTLLLVGDNLFCFRFMDTVRSEIAKTIDALHKEKMRLVMLTGDRIENAEPIAKGLGIDEVYASLTPEEKLNHVINLSEKEGLIMVGDGINDAPALARSTVGISMGQVGSAAAVDASDVVLLQDKLEHLPWLIKKAHKTLSIVKQNLTLALAVIILATTPALLGLVPLWMAVILHEGGTLLVGLNSLRLLR